MKAKVASMPVPPRNVAGDGRAWIIRAPFSLAPALVIIEPAGRDRDCVERVGAAGAGRLKHVACAVRSCSSLTDRRRPAVRTRPGLDAASPTSGGRIEEHDDVDVAGILSSTSPILHMASTMYRAFLRAVGIDRRECPARSGPPRRGARRRRPRVRQVRNARLPHHLPQSADIDERDREGCFRFSREETASHRPWEALARTSLPACARQTRPAARADS